MTYETEFVREKVAWQQEWILYELIDLRHL